jgi:hypothetical protein
VVKEKGTKTAKYTNATGLAYFDLNAVVILSLNLIKTRVTD